VSTVPVALAASTGPNYTELIESLSNSTNNILFASGNFEGALAQLVDPLVSATGGSVGAGTTQADLLTVDGLLTAVQLILNTFATPNFIGVPGLPAGAGSVLNPVLTGANGIASPVLAAVGGLLAAAQGVLTGVEALSLPVVGVLGVPALEDLIPGLTASLTAYNSYYNLPLGGLGTLLGLQGSTTATNIFTQIPSLTASSLVTGILNGLTLTVAGQPVAVPDLVKQLVGTTLGLPPLSTLLNLVNTPTVTAWIPTAGGTYGLPLGGSFGYLATMPTLDVGPLAVGPLVLSDTDTVLAVPIGAAGVTLPLGLASFGMLGTPGIVLPTATGVDTIGGLSVTSFSIPMLGITYLNTNVQGANYYGTNGIDYSNGQNVGALVTPLGTIPIIYSLGSFNFGDDGFGFAGPSLFGVGLIPPIQVGAAPTQQSPDGIIPADGLVSLNTLFTAGRALSPTQLTSVTEALGIPNVGQSLADAVLTPGYQALVTPLATPFTAYLNQNLGSWVNGGASGFEQLTAAIANVSYGLPGATTPTVPPAGESADALTMQSTPQLVADKKTNPSPVVEQTAAVVPTADTKDAADPIKNVQNQVRNANTQITTSITAANAKTKAAVSKATADIEKSVKKTSDTLNKIAKEGEAQVKKAVEGVQKTVKAAGDSVSKNVKTATEKAKAK
jgi:hypothetical protein